MVYGAPVWHVPSDTPAKGARGTAKNLQKHQQNCLRVVLGAFKSTAVTKLEIESYVPPLDLWLNGRVACYQARLELSGVGQQIRDACAVIRGRILARTQQRRRRTVGELHANTPGTKRKAWTERWTGGRIEDWDQRAKEKVLADWKDRWKAWRAKDARPERGRRTPGSVPEATIDTVPTAQILKLHDGLQKAESSILVQVRTGSIGLRKHLHRRRVPGFATAQCACGGGEETPRHIALVCEQEINRRDRLRLASGRPVTYGRLTGTPKGAKVFSEWMIKSGRLGQFSLARQLLYG